MSRIKEIVYSHLWCHSLQTTCLRKKRVCINNTVNESHSKHEDSENSLSDILSLLDLWFCKQTDVWRKLQNITIMELSVIAIYYWNKTIRTDSVSCTCNIGRCSYKNILCLIILASAFQSMQHAWKLKVSVSILVVVQWT